MFGGQRFQSWIPLFFLPILFFASLFFLSPESRRSPASRPPKRSAPLVCDAFDRHTPQSHWPIKWVNTVFHFQTTNDDEFPGNFTPDGDGWRNDTNLLHGPKQGKKANGKLWAYEYLRGVNERLAHADALDEFYRPKYGNQIDCSVDADGKVTIHDEGVAPDQLPWKIRFKFKHSQEKSVLRSIYPITGMYHFSDLSTNLLGDGQIRQQSIEKRNRGELKAHELVFLAPSNQISPWPANSLFPRIQEMKPFAMNIYIYSRSPLLPANLVYPSDQLFWIDPQSHSAANDHGIIGVHGTDYGFVATSPPTSGSGFSERSVHLHSPWMKWIFSHYSAEIINTDEYIENLGYENAGIGLHEFGHAFGLGHTFQQGLSVNSGIRVYTQGYERSRELAQANVWQGCVPGSESPSCGYFRPADIPVTTEYKACKLDYGWDPQADNNIMNYAEKGAALTPDQLRSVHYNLSKDYRHWIYAPCRSPCTHPSKCIYHHRIDGNLGRIRWDSDQFIAGNLFIGSGTTLVIGCGANLYMPMNSKITGPIEYEPGSARKTNCLQKKVLLRPPTLGATAPHNSGESVSEALCEENQRPSKR